MTPTKAKKKKIVKKVAVVNIYCTNFEKHVINLNEKHVCFINLYYS